MTITHSEDTASEILVHNLTFSFTPTDPGVSPSLVDVSLQLPKGSRTILIGANGGTSVSQESSFTFEQISCSWKINAFADSSGQEASVQRWHRCKDQGPGCVPPISSWRHIFGHRMVPFMHTNSSRKPTETCVGQ